MINWGVALLAWLALWNTSPSPFRRQQAAAQARSPRGLVVRLTTPGHRTIFHVGERVRLQTEYSSAVPHAFEVDIADDHNVPPLTDEFYIFPPGHRLLKLYGAECCQARRVLLTARLVVVKSHMVLRFPAPQTALLYMTTQRVFRSHDPNLYKASSLHSASQMLRLEIVPADEAWQEQALKATQRELVGHAANDPKDWPACRDLAGLDIPAALALKIRWLRTSGPCSINSIFQSFARLPEAETVLLQLMKEPEVGITPGMMKSLIEVRLRQSQRWLFTLNPESPQDFPENVMSMGYAATTAGEKAVEELRPSLARKTLSARAASETTFGQFSTAAR